MTPLGNIGNIERVDGYDWLFESEETMKNLDIPFVTEELPDELVVGGRYTISFKGGRRNYPLRKEIPLYIGEYRVGLVEIELIKYASHLIIGGEFGPNNRTHLRRGICFVDFRPTSFSYDRKEHIVR